MTKVNRNEAKIKELRESNTPIYSFSKLGTINQCEYEYFNSYIAKNKGISNVYSELGSAIHDAIESFYKNDINKNEAKNMYTDKLSDLEILNLKFPSEQIGVSYNKDLTHYFDNFKKINNKAILEYHVLFELENVWMQGYIDAIFSSDKKGYVNIIDWKSSSKFTGYKLIESGRQLLLYKLAIEATTNAKVDKLMWCMLKYVTVKYLKSEEVINERKCKIDGWVKTIRKQLHKLVVENGVSEEDATKYMDIAVNNNNLSNLPKSVQDMYWLKELTIDGEISDTHLLVCSVKSPRKYGSKMCSRRKWVLEMREKFEKELIDNNLDEMEIDILLDDAVKNNDISNLPSYIKDKYWIEDCYVEYEVDEEKIQELKDYVNNTIKMIESKDVNNPDDWKPLNIHNDSFYCNHLCNHRSTCEFLKEYKANLNLQPKAIFDDLDGIL